VLVGFAPLEVRGTGFAIGTRVTVTVATPARRFTTVLRVDRAGSFVYTTPAMRIVGCTPVSVTAVSGLARVTDSARAHCGAIAVPLSP
jgi:hypothetical protein